MIIRKIDDNGDWLFGHGLTDYNQNENAVDENIRTRVLSWLSDCFFSLQEGVDWRNRLEIGQQEELKDEIATVILQSAGVMGINSITLEFDGQTRAAIINANIETIYSPSFQTAIELSAGV